MKSRGVEFAREARKRQTRGEAMLWDALRGRALGVRFYREEPVGSFRPDFVCKRPRLIVEIDGPVHDDQQWEDSDRQRVLEEMGYRVLRVSDYQAERHTKTIVERLRAVIAEMQSGAKERPGRAPRS
jgi:very-short-patch-repair endonuclease